MSSSRVWLDATAYGRALLLQGGELPFGDAAALARFYRDLCGLLRPDDTAFPLGAFAEAWVRAHPEAAERMRAKDRRLHALKTLLADEGLRASVAEALGALAGGVRTTGWWIELPDLGAAPLRLRALVGLEAGEPPTPDDADSAGVYFADFLPAVSAGEIRGVVFATRPEVHDSWAETFTSLVNVARHYRWSHAFRRLGPAGDGLCHGVVPAAATPEVVLEQLARLRG